MSTSVPAAPYLEAESIAPYTGAEAALNTYLKGISSRPENNRPANNRPANNVIIKGYPTIARNIQRGSTGKKYNPARLQVLHTEYERLIRIPVISHPIGDAKITVMKVMDDRVTAEYQAISIEGYKLSTEEDILAFIETMQDKDSFSILSITLDHPFTNFIILCTIIAQFPNIHRLELKSMTYDPSRKVYLSIDNSNLSTLIFTDLNVCFDTLKIPMLQGIEVNYVYSYPRSDKTIEIIGNGTTTMKSFDNKDYLKKYTITGNGKKKVKIIAFEMTGRVGTGFNDDSRDLIKTFFEQTGRENEAKNFIRKNNEARSAYNGGRRTCYRKKRIHKRKTRRHRQ
jgi:hypothetical protein